MKYEGSVLLSCETVFQLQHLDVRPRLEYLPPRATLISSAADYPKKEVHAQSRSTKQQSGTDDAHSGSIAANSIHIKYQEDTPKKIKIVKTKKQIKEHHPELFERIGRFPGELYHIHTDPSITTEQTP